MDLLDSYVLRARLFPAVLAVAPGLLLALVTTTSSYDGLSLPQVLITVTAAVLFFALSDLARRFGLHAEKEIFSESGGRPFPSVLRHSDDAIDSKTKARYHAFLSGVIGEEAPCKRTELNNPVAADMFYIACGIWLRENTRDKNKFPVLTAENIVYGFRRNLYGLKLVGLGINAITVAVCLWLITDSDENVLPRYGTVLIFAAIHAIYFLCAVTRHSVVEASQRYARQLVLSIETLMHESSKSASRSG